MKNNQFIALISVKTNYNKNEFKQVLDKILSKPWAEYDDCDIFEHKVLKIAKVNINQKSNENESTGLKDN